MIILVDSSVWIKHFKTADPALQALLQHNLVASHPYVIAEVACGTPPAPRAHVLNLLRKFEQAKTASVEEVIAFIESAKLYGRGCGFVDLALLASTLIGGNMLLWTHDKRLAGLAAEMGRAYSPADPVQPPRS